MSWFQADSSGAEGAFAGAEDVGRKQKRTKVNFTAYGDESDHGVYRIPFKALVEGGQTSDGDRHVLTVDRVRCELDELYRGFARKTTIKRVAPRSARSTLAYHWNADSG